jgi:hypothetical protein
MALVGKTVGESSDSSRCPSTVAHLMAGTAAMGSIRSVSILLVLFLFHNQFLFADASESNRQRILAGEGLYFNTSAPEDARTIDAKWIEEAVKRRLQIRVSNAVIRGDLVLRNSNVEQEFDLDSCTFKGVADFSYATFKRDFSVIEAVFREGVFFQSAVFEQRAVFQRTRFEGTPISFTYAHFFGEFSAEEAKFGMKPATVDFSHSRFDAGADFAKSVISVGVMFTAAQFRGTGFFPGTRFKGVADFRRAHFFDNAIFGGGPPADFNATFEDRALFWEAQFDSFADFHGVLFNGTAEFVDARFDSDADFVSTLFQGRVSFRSVIFHAVYLSEAAAGNPPQFGKDVDLLGCTYDRIKVDWHSLLQYPNGRSRVSPYNRQPYIELEDVLRKAGFEEDADQVYAERRLVENGKGLRKVWDRLYWLTANYGIDLSHELMGSLAFLLFGMWFFSRTGAVTNGEAEAEITISWLSALLLSFRQFLPFSLPVKPRWNPSRQVLFRLKSWPLLTAAFYANLLQVVGWIFIPLATASLAGVLHHTGQ